MYTLQQFKEIHGLSNYQIRKLDKRINDIKTGKLEYGEGEVKITQWLQDRVDTSGHVRATAQHLSNVLSIPLRTVERVTAKLIKAGKFKSLIILKDGIKTVYISGRELDSSAQARLALRVLGEPEPLYCEDTDSHSLQDDDRPIAIKGYDSRAYTTYTRKELRGIANTQVEFSIDLADIPY